MAYIIDCSSGRLPEKEIPLIRNALLGGKIVAFPTTVYGLAASALSKEGCEGIYGLKGRSREKPLILMSDRLEKMLPYLEAVPAEAKKLLERLPPGSLTLIVRASKTLPDYLNLAEKTIGFRLADNPVAERFMSLFREPVATTSANLSGHPPCPTAREVAATFGDQIELVLQWDAAIGGTPSTILDMSGKEPKILREGSLSERALRKLLKE